MGTIFCIDIGSNSVRLAKIKDNNTVYKKCSITRLAKNINNTGILSRQARNDTIDAVTSYYKIALKEKSPVYIFATEALRKAKNGKLFARQIEKLTSTNVDILTPEQEALAGYTGAIKVLGDCKGVKDNATVIDIGGASTEIISGGNEINYINSLPLGVVTLYDICKRDKNALDDVIIKHLAAVPKNLCGSCVCVGGTATSVAAMDIKLKTYDASKINGHTISLDRLIQIRDMLFDMPVSKIKGLDGLQPQRAGTISGGVYLLCAVIKHLQKECIIISDFDNIEGYAAINLLI